MICIPVIQLPTGNWGWVHKIPSQVWTLKLRGCVHQKEEKHSSKTLTQLWMYCSYCLIAIDRRTDCPICYLDSTGGNEDLCHPHVKGLCMVCYLPTYQWTLRPLFHSNLWDISNKRFLRSDAFIVVNISAQNEGIPWWRNVWLRV